MSRRQHRVAERADVSRPALHVAAALSGRSAPSAHAENGACSRCDGRSLRRLFRMFEGVRSCHVLEENGAISLWPDGDLESGRAGEAHAGQPYVTTDAAAAFYRLWEGIRTDSIQGAASSSSPAWLALV